MSEEARVPGPADALDRAAVRAWVEDFLARIDSERGSLGELDRRSGDGDFGSNLETAGSKARVGLEKETGGSAGGPFAALSSAFLGTGGASGPLFGMWFRELAGAAEGEGGIDLDALARAAGEGLAAVQRLGKAKVGDKTMVDAMQPAVAALADSAARGSAPSEALAAAATAARQGAATTGEMVARRGRATYVGEVSRGVVDPGAVAVAILFEAGAATAAS